MKKQQSSLGRATASGKKTAHASRDTKRRGEIGEVEAFCGRESERRENRSPQPISRSLNGEPSEGRRGGTSLETGRCYTKRRGEIGEAAFLSKAASMGFGVAKPWGDSDRHDLVVDAGGRLLKVQVKSAHRVCAQAGGGYHFRAHPHQRTPYRADEIDLLVAYIVPENIWYVFPPNAFKNMKSMRLFPHRGKKMSKFEQYREAWHLLRECAQS